MKKQISGTTAVVVIVVVILIVALVGWRVLAKKGGGADEEPEPIDAQPMMMDPGTGSTADSVPGNIQGPPPGGR